LKRSKEALGAELVPFLFMDSSEACEALAEYAVLLDGYIDVRRSWLTPRINEAVRRAAQSPDLPLPELQPWMSGVKWVDLLDDDNASRFGLNAAPSELNTFPSYRRLLTEQLRREEERLLKDVDPAPSSKILQGMGGIFKVIDDLTSVAANSLTAGLTLKLNEKRLPRVEDMKSRLARFDDPRPWTPDEVTYAMAWVGTLRDASTFPSEDLMPADEMVNAALAELEAFQKQAVGHSVAEGEMGLMRADGPPKSDGSTTADTVATADLMAKYGITFDGESYYLHYYQATIRYREVQSAVAGAMFLRAPRQPVPLVFTVVGGSGWNLPPGTSCFLTVDKAALQLDHEPCGRVSIPFADLISVDVTGPGTEKHDGGVIGGGFGLKGAVTGMLAAAALNALTSRTTTNTFLRLATREAEVFLHTSTAEPTSLRMLMSPAIVCLEAGRRGDTGGLPARFGSWANCGTRACSRRTSFAPRNGDYSATSRYNNGIQPGNASRWR